MPTRPTPAEPTPEGYAERVLGRKEMGLTFIKFDVRLHVLEGVEGGDGRARRRGTNTTWARRWAARRAAAGGHQVTDKGIAAFGRDRGRRARGGRLGRLAVQSTTLATAI